MKNQDRSLKEPLFDLEPSECDVRCQNLIGSYASTHSTFNLIGSCNRNLNTQNHRDTYAQTTDIMSYLFKIAQKAGIMNIHCVTILLFENPCAMWLQN